MKITHLLAAAAATALIGGAAYAQNAETTSPAAVPDQAPASEATTPTDTAPAASTDAATDSATTAPAETAVNPPAADSAAGVSTDAAAVSSPGQTGQTVNISTVTNGPVADTPENRAKYKPLSRAGNRTAAAGN